MGILTENFQDAISSGLFLSATLLQIRLVASAQHENELRIKNLRFGSGMTDFAYPRDVRFLQ
jgi:hypothetical protein